MAEETTHALQPGQYRLSDPALLMGMRLQQEIKVPGSDAILVPRYTPITTKLVARLVQHGVETLFAEPVQEKAVVTSVEQMKKMFTVIENVVSGALGGVEDIALSFQNQQQIRDLERLIQSNLNDIDSLFKSDPTEKLMALTQHHSGTARHSIMASFHLMAIGRELGWPDGKIVRGAIAVFNHDVGKTRVKLETLDWPGRLDGNQWKEMQLHPLFGCRLLYRVGEKPDLSMLTALLHHEWHAEVAGKGYGGLTLFADYLKRTLQLDIPKVVAELDRDDLDCIQASSLVDMVSALEERRAYKRELDSFKVLVIMNSDAMLGHFHPEHYAAWHRIYMRQNPNLLPRGRRFALPREKERRVFTPQKPRKVSQLGLLTYQEMEQLGFMPVLRNVGMDEERIRRRGGLTLKVLEQIKNDKRLEFDCSPEAIRAAGLNPIKDQVVPEMEMIELDVWREWLTWDELERSGLLAKAKAHLFDLELIRKDGGMRPERLVKRGIPLNEKKLASQGILILKPWTIKLPGSENRLTAADLLKLGVSDQQLEKAGCLDRVRKVKSGVPMDWLVNQGIMIVPADLGKNGIDPIRKVFYDILVTEEISSTRARFMLLREGDEVKNPDENSNQDDPDPIRNLLLNKIGEVVIDFVDLVAMPDLSGVTMGDHWGVRR
ncbi:MAG: hypothetical protein HQL63_01710 [Magnetococcales bacterium]|nr:hypothetical protein [Magnetococcales bacterium]MBF0323074.1 hypothetical protein [Magnetococcales bacterium]